MKKYPRFAGDGFDMRLHDQPQLVPGKDELAQQARRTRVKLAEI